MAHQFYSLVNCGFIIIISFFFFFAFCLFTLTIPPIYHVLIIILSLFYISHTHNKKIEYYILSILKRENEQHQTILFVCHSRIARSLSLYVLALIPFDRLNYMHTQFVREIIAFFFHSPPTSIPILLLLLLLRCLCHRMMNV